MAQMRWKHPEKAVGKIIVNGHNLYAVFNKVVPENKLLIWSELLLEKKLKQIDLDIEPDNKRALKRCEWVSNYVHSSTRFLDLKIGDYTERIPLAPSYNGKTIRHHVEGFIYIVTDGYAVKIGKSHEPKSRIRAIQTNNPRKIYVLAIIPVEDMDVAEQSIHYHYCKYHIRNEWFDLLPLFNEATKKEYEEVKHA